MLCCALWSVASFSFWDLFGLLQVNTVGTPTNSGPVISCGCPPGCQAFSEQVGIQCNLISEPPLPDCPINSSSSYCLGAQSILFSHPAVAVHHRADAVLVSAFWEWHPVRCVPNHKHPFGVHSCWVHSQGEACENAVYYLHTQNGPKRRTLHTLNGHRYHLTNFLSACVTIYLAFFAVVCVWFVFDKMSSVLQFAV